MFLFFLSDRGMIKSPAIIIGFSISPISLLEFSMDILGLWYELYYMNFINYGILCFCWINPFIIVKTPFLFLAILHASKSELSIIMYFSWLSFSYSFYSVSFKSFYFQSQSVFVSFYSSFKTFLLNCEFSLYP